MLELSSDFGAEIIRMVDPEIYLLPPPSRRSVEFGMVQCQI